MKNITLSAQDDKIDQFRRAAREQNTTANDVFRQWLDSYLEKYDRERRQKMLKALKDSFEYLSFTSERKYTREEMNER